MASSSVNLRLLALLCLLSVGLLPGCGDETISAGGIEVSPTRVTIGVNQTQFFTALGRSGGGFLISTSPTWSLDSSAIGTIRSSGLFSAGSVEAAGRVIATDGLLAGSAEVTITKHGWLRGIVTDSNAAAVIGIRVFLTELPLLGDETDSSGSYIIADIPAGTYEARIDPSARYSEGATQEVTIGEGETVTTFNPVLFTPTTTSTTTTLPF